MTAPSEVPDVNSPEFKRRVHDKAATLNAADRRDGTAEFLEDIQDDVLADL